MVGGAVTTRGGLTTPHGGVSLVISNTKGSWALEHGLDWVKSDPSKTWRFLYSLKVSLGFGKGKKKRQMSMT